ARLALQPPLDRVPLVHDMVDVDSAKWYALAKVTWPPMSWIYSREADRLASFEALVTRHAVETLLTTEQERGQLRSLVPNASIEVLQNGVDAGALRPPNGPANSSTVVFCGVMNYTPNEQGAIWLAREVWPQVLRREPSACLQLVGTSPTAAVRRLASTDQ